MYETILLPTDGSHTTTRALEYAADLAAQYDAELRILYVIDSTVFANDVEAEPIVEEFEEVGASIVDDVSRNARDVGVGRVATDVVRGTPHEEILAYAHESDADLIVMGTHGRTGLDRYLLGSVTEKVVRLSDVPVMTVRQSDEE